jgi:sugar lactone lactonase YvrE
VSLSLAACDAGPANHGPDVAPDTHADADVTPLPPELVLVAGSPGAGTRPDGTAPRFVGPTALTTCPAFPDEVFIADSFGFAIYRAHVPSGLVTRIAGHPTRPGLADGPPAEARFASPRGLACLADSSALIAADSGAFRRIDLASGAVATVAGFPGTPGNTDGDAIDARIGYLIHAMVTDPGSGAIFFSDRSNDAIRRLDPDTFSVTTISPASAGWSGPGGLAFSSNGTRLIVADTFNDRLRTLDSTSGDVVAADIAVTAPQGIAVAGDAAWTVGFEPPLRRVDLATGTVSTFTTDFAGSFASPVIVGKTLVTVGLEDDALTAWDLDATSPPAQIIAGPIMSDTAVDGAPRTARFGALTDLVMASNGTVAFVADAALGLVRRVDLDVPETWGTETVGRVESVDLALLIAPADRPEPLQPTALALTPDESRLFVADAANRTIWAVSLDADFRPIAVVRAAANVAPVAAMVVGPQIGSAVPDPASHLYAAQRGAHRVLRFDIRTLPATPQVVAGSGVAGHRDGPASDSRLNAPSALALDPAASRLFIGEADGRALRVLDYAPEARVTSWLAPPSDDETPARDGAVAEAVVGGITGLAVAPDGHLLVADGGAGALRLLVRDNDGLPTRLATIVGSLGEAGGLTADASPPLSAPALGRVARPVFVPGAPAALLVPSDNTLVGLRNLPADLLELETFR